MFENKMASMCGQPKHNLLCFLAGTVVSLLELISTQFVVNLDYKVAFVMCAACVVLCMAWYDVTRAELAAHFLGMSLITWYQSFFIIEEIHAEWWLELFMLGVVVVAYVLDSYVMSIKSIDASCRQDTRDGYGYVIGTVLLILAFIPLQNVGLFNLADDPLYAMAFLLVWPLLAYSESMRRLTRSLEICLPHSAIKSLAIFYLPPRSWPFFFLVSIVNLVRIPSSSKRTEPDTPNMNSAAAPPSAFRSTNVFQRSTNSNVVAYGQYAGSDDTIGSGDGDVEHDVNVEDDIKK